MYAAHINLKCNIIKFQIIVDSSPSTEKTPCNPECSDDELCTSDDDFKSYRRKKSYKCHKRPDLEQTSVFRFIFILKVLLK